LYNAAATAQKDFLSVVSRGHETTMATSSPFPMSQRPPIAPSPKAAERWLAIDGGDASQEDAAEHASFELAMEATLARLAEHRPCAPPALPRLPDATPSSELWPGV